MNDTEYKPFGELSREEQLKLFNAWLDGKEIEFFNVGFEQWQRILSNRPSWEKETKYRIKPTPKTKPSINWDHVAKEFKWMATDDTGNTHLYDSKPMLKRGFWEPQGTYQYYTIVMFSSFTPGNCDWKDSLVERPE